MATEPAHVISEAAILAGRDHRRPTDRPDLPARPEVAREAPPSPRLEAEHTVVPSLARGPATVGTVTHLEFLDPEDSGGRLTVPLETVDDLKGMLAGLPLDRITLSTTRDGDLLPALASLIVTAEELGVPASRLEGSIRQDAITALLTGPPRGLQPSMSRRVVADMLEYGAAHLPRLKPVTVSGQRAQATGVPHALELALTLAAGREYVHVAMARGLGVDEFASQLEFSWAIGRHFYLEVAKLRAARQIWRRMMKTLGATSTESLTLHACFETAAGPAVVQQSPEAHMRSAIGAMAAAFGGTQFVTSESEGPGDRPAADTVLQEAHVTEIDDPWAGSYMMESLTQDMVRASTQWLTDIDAQGGFVPSIESGWMQARVSAVRSHTGTVNSPQHDGLPERLHSPESVGAAPLVRHGRCRVSVVHGEVSARVRGARHEPTVQRVLCGLSAATRSGHRNLLQLTLAAMRARATIHEVSTALESASGRPLLPFTESDVRHPEPLGHNHSRPLDDDIEVFVQRAGRRPRLLVVRGSATGDETAAVTMGDVFARQGFDVDIGLPVQALDECISQVVDDDVHAVGVVRSDVAHIAQVPALADALRRDGLSGVPLFVAGVTDPEEQDFLYGCGITAISGVNGPTRTEVMELLWHVRLLAGWQ